MSEHPLDATTSHDDRAATWDVPTLATALPPGWIELVAFRTAERLTGFLRAQLAVDAARFTPEQADQLIDACRRAHGLAVRERWLHLGCIVTDMPDGDTLRTTVWTIGLGVLQVPTFGDVDPLGVGARVLGSRGTIETVLDVELDDGRRGLVVGGHTAAGPGADLAASSRLPQLDPERLGLYGVLLPLPGAQGRLVLSLGISPCVAERQAMSVVAGQMATSVHVVEDVGRYSPDSVLVDTTGLVHPDGFLGGDPHA